MEKKLQLIIMSAEEQQANTSLLERIQRPEVSKETAKKISLIEEQFARAEVEQCMFFYSFLFLLSFGFFNFGVCLLDWLLLFIWR